MQKEKFKPKEDKAKHGLMIIQKISHFGGEGPTVGRRRKRERKKSRRRRKKEEEENLGLEIDIG